LNWSKPVEDQTVVGVDGKNNNAFSRTGKSAPNVDHHRQVRSAN